MRRILFSWREVRVWSHPACLYAGLVLGVLAQQAAARAAGLDTARSYVVVLLLIPAAHAGNRLLWVATDPAAYRAAGGAFWRRDGGGVMYGGLPAVLLVSIPLLSALGLPFWRFWDTMVFCILPAMAAGRIGCLLNGCCHGRPTDSALALRLPDTRGEWRTRYPTQLLEAGIALLILAGAALIGPARQAPGALFLLVVASYAVARLALQPLREIAVRFRGVDLSLAVSLALLLASAVGLAMLG